VSLSSIGPSIDDPALACLIAHAAAAHPGIAEPPALRERLAACVAAGVKDLEARAADLYLAAACVAGDAAAIARLEAALSAIVHPALARIGLSKADDDEIVLQVRVALLVRDETGRCRLVGYSGRGELRAYLRAVAVRIALNRRRGSEPSSGDAELLACLPDAADSPELALLKQRYRNDLRLAFATAVAALTPRERTLLRQHYVDGLTMDRLGPLHRAHRATCARWIEAARVKILRGVRRELRAKLALDGAELESAVALVRSQLDLSLCRHLASRDA
jgi:RNA polymerase sigma-70 factor (ECF subfamily)